MIEITNKDFGLLILAKLAENNIKIINKPLLERKIYTYLSMQKEKKANKIFNGLNKFRDLYDENNQYINLNQAFIYAFIKGFLSPGKDEIGNSITINGLTKENAQRISMLMDKRYGSDYSLLADEIVKGIYNIIPIYKDDKLGVEKNPIVKKPLTKKI